MAITVNEKGVIVEAAPLVRKFIGQHFVNLLRWARARGGLEWEELN